MTTKCSGVVRFCLRSIAQAGLVLSLTGCSQLVWVSGYEQVQVPADGIQKLDVKSHNGSIHVDASSDAIAEISVDVTKKCGGRSLEDAQTCLDAMQIVSATNGETHRLTWKYETPRRPNWSSSVSFDVTAPAEVAVKAVSHNGSVDVSGARGGCDVTSHNGSIELTEVSGDCLAESHNGRIVISSHSGDIRAESHNGRIEVSGAPHKACVIARNGRVKAKLRTDGEVSGTISTHNGSVTVELGEETSANLSASTHNGSLRCTRALDECRFNRHTLTGKLGEAEGELEITTHNGSVRIR